jgi:ribosomal protein L13E
MCDLVTGGKGNSVGDSEEAGLSTKSAWAIGMIQGYNCPERQKLSVPAENT